MAALDLARGGGGLGQDRPRVGREAAGEAVGGVVVDAREVEEPRGARRRRERLLDRAAREQPAPRGPRDGARERAAADGRGDARRSRARDVVLLEVGGDGTDGRARAVAVGAERRRAARGAAAVAEADLRKGARENRGERRAARARERETVVVAMSAGRRRSRTLPRDTRKGSTWAQRSSGMGSARSTFLSRRTLGGVTTAAPSAAAARATAPGVGAMRHLRFVASWPAQRRRSRRKAVERRSTGTARSAASANAARAAAEDRGPGSGCAPGQPGGRASATARA